MDTPSVTKRSWAEVNLRLIENNYKAYKSLLSPTGKIIAVVKADAYGHGDVEVCHALARQGANCFAVSNIDEAIRLRINGIVGEIIVLGYTPKDNFSDLEKYDVTQTLIDEKYAQMLFDSGIDVKCQFAIDTGMNRIGIDADNLKHCEAILRKYCKKLRINGIFTHLCVADSVSYDDIEFTKRQLEKFNNLKKHLSDLNLTFSHSLNSAGGLSFFDGGFVRVGILLYGLKPNYKMSLPDGILPALTWKSVISMIKKVRTGESIGYGRSFIANQDMFVATLPTGYGDGYRRDLSDCGYVLVRGEKAKIVGKICMDQMMIDVSEIIRRGTDNLEVGEEVVLIGQSGNSRITADDLANCIGTIGYEIVCGISKRVPRLYING